LAHVSLSGYDFFSGELTTDALVEAAVAKSLACRAKVCRLATSAANSPSRGGACRVILQGAGSIRLRVHRIADDLSSETTED
jgi:hypothetical protein